MADKTEAPTSTPPHQSVEIPISEAASAVAPFIFFDNASAFGHYNSVVHVTLEATRFIPRGVGQVGRDRVIVGHLRMNLQSAESLRSALEGALLMARQAGSEVRN